MYNFKIGSLTIYDIKKNKKNSSSLLLKMKWQRIRNQDTYERKPKLEILVSVLYTWFSVKRS